MQDSIEHSVNTILPHELHLSPRPILLYIPPLSILVVPLFCLFLMAPPIFKRSQIEPIIRRKWIIHQC